MARKSRVVVQTGPRHLEMRELPLPEIDADKVTFSQGMDVTICTSTDNDDEARELLRLFGMPFREA